MKEVSGTRIIFRVDASLQIGTGHVMRCLTLAQALRAGGARCQFVCRAHDGHLIDDVTRQSFAVTALPTAAQDCTGASGSPAHASWLGCSAGADAQQTLAALEHTQFDCAGSDLGVDRSAPGVAPDGDRRSCRSKP
jgi:hypothetical protein